MSNQDKILEFESFSLDTEQGILWQHGKRVPLSRRPMAMLLMLVENRHRVVTRDELMEEVWAGVIVEDANIATNIARLRQALANGDGKNGSGNARQYIETIHGYGYQFVAEVREHKVEEDKTDTPKSIILPSPPPPPPQPSNNVVPVPLPLPFYRDWRYQIGFATVIVAVIVWLLLPTKQNKTPGWSDPSEIISWKNRFGDVGLLVRPSHDGRLVAYAKSETDRQHIFVQPVGARTPARLTNDEWPDFDPIWSPDDRQIAYQSIRDGAVEVAVIDLVTRQRNVVSTFEAGNKRLLRWSKKERKLFYTDEKNVFALGLDSGQTANLTNFAPEQGASYQFGLSLDEEKIAYVKNVGGRRMLFVARIDGREPAQLTQAGQNIEYPEWLSDNRHILYTRNEGGSVQVRQIGLDGGKPVDLTPKNVPAELQHISPDGKKAFYSVGRQEADLFRYDLKTGVEKELALEPGLKLWPQISPDGKTLVFQRADKEENIMRSAIMGTSLETNQLSGELTAEGFDPRWSPNGEKLAFLKRADGGYELWRLDLPGSAQRVLTKAMVPNAHRKLQWEQPSNYSWSPDGSRLAYCTINNKVINIQTISADGSTKSDRSRNTDAAWKLTSPLWSPDGKNIAYLAQTSWTGKAQRAIVVNDGQQDKTIFRSDLPIRMIGWADSRHFLAGLMEPNTLMVGELKLVRISLTGGESQEVVGQSLPVYFNSLRLSPDGKTLAFTARQNDCDNIQLYSLDTRKLRKLTANKETHQHLNGLSWLPDNLGICFSKQSTSTSIWVMERATDAKQ